MRVLFDWSLAQATRKPPGLGDRPSSPPMATSFGFNKAQSGKVGGASLFLVDAGNLSTNTHQP